MNTCTPGLLICGHHLPGNTWKTKFSTLTFCGCSTNLERSLCWRLMCGQKVEWVKSVCKREKKKLLTAKRPIKSSPRGFEASLEAKALNKKKDKKWIFAQQFYFFSHTPTLVNTLVGCGPFSNIVLHLYNVTSATMSREKHFYKNMGVKWYGKIGRPAQPRQRSIDKGAGLRGIDMLPLNELRFGVRCAFVGAKSKLGEHVLKNRPTDYPLWYELKDNNLLCQWHWKVGLTRSTSCLLKSLGQSGGIWAPLRSHQTDGAVSLRWASYPRWPI